MKAKITYIYTLLLCFVVFQSSTYAQYGTKSLNWNTKAYEKLSFTSSDGTMPYRLLKPANYNKSIKYPLVIMLHGRGEGRSTPCASNPDCVLSWGGKMHLDYNSQYPGFVVFPQTYGGDWGDKPLRMVKGIMTKLTQTYNIDLDRIYIHGLSAGGQGAWRMVLGNPHVFAAASPHSAAGDASKAGNILFNPIWTVQGEKDTSPRPSNTMYMMQTLQKFGKKPIYTYNATTKKQVWPAPNTTEPIYTLAAGRGHEAWPVLYDSKAWEQWMFAQRKNRIISIGGSQVGPGKTITLGIASGFLAYEWSNGATTNQIKVTQPGTYRVRYKRYANIWSGAQVWSNWSDPFVVTGSPAKVAMKMEADTIPSVKGFSLINADNNSVIRQIQDGDHIDLAELPARNVHIRADIDSLAGTIVFNHNGQEVRVDQAPYILQGNHQDAILETGEHTLTATPHTSSDGQDVPGSSITIKFLVTDKGKDEYEEAAAEDPVSLYPNPVQDKIWLRFPKEQSDVRVFIYDKYGTLIHQTMVNQGGEVLEAEIDISGLSLHPDVYVVRVTSARIREQSFRIMKN